MHTKVLCIVHQRHSRVRRVGRILKEMGYVLDIRKPCIGDPLPENMENYVGTIIFGGPMSAYEDDKYEFLRTELRWIPRIIDEGQPLIGICLGAQLLARVLGARVFSRTDGKYEIGYFPIYPTKKGDVLFNGKKIFHAYQWHKDTFELPVGAELLASGDRFDNQVFCYGKNSIGLQFHPELTPSTMITWSTLGKKRGFSGVQPISEMIRMCNQYERNVREWLARFLYNFLVQSKK